MGDFPSRSSSVRNPAGDLLRSTLSQIPTVFGRLVYLASLHDLASGRYSHEPLEHLLGVEEADRVIRANHHQVFTKWLGWGLAEQKADLEQHIASQPGNNSFSEYSRAAPVTARDVERQLYLTDLETLLELIRFERGGAFWFPEA